MKPEAKDVVLAILTRLKEKEASAGKTKLLKLLYLSDIEHYRKTHDTLTGFDWIFYFYGPWSANYDQLLDQLAAEDVIGRREWNASQLDGEEVFVKEPRALDRVVRDTDEYFRILRLIDTWADRSTPELLDYVYFDTEPMFGAERMAPLDFSRVSADAPRPYRRTRGASSPERKTELRRKFRDVRQAIEAEAKQNLADFRPAPYDDDYFRALEILNTPGE